MLKEYYSDIIEEFTEHISKRKELLDKVKEISTKSSPDSVDLSEYITEVGFIEELLFQRRETVSSVVETVVCREIHDFVKSFGRLNNFYNLQRADLYSKAEEEYDNMDQLLDFKRAALEGKL